MAAQSSSSSSKKEGGGVGNTRPHPVQESPRLHWCFTYNNYTELTVSSISSRLSDICKKYVFQEETGESGTPHLQGYVHLLKKQRFNTIIPEIKEIHWEHCNNIDASIEYCQKEDTRTGKVYKFGFPKPLKLISELRPWQKEIDTLLKKEPDDRKVYWYYDTVGNIGKSAFTKYCVAKYNALPINSGKHSDLINMVFNYLEKNEELNCVIIDVPRNNGNHVSYTAIEDIKNGLIVNTKYETGCKLFNSPHVIVFANEPPDLSKLSADRWIITDISNYELKI